jgi:hypothetical protein
MGMEPLKPELKKSILENNPQADPRDLEEYERLLSLRFTEDPDQELAASPVAEQRRTLSERREARIEELHQKLFKSAAERAASPSST